MIEDILTPKSRDDIIQELSKLNKIKLNKKLRQFIQRNECLENIKLLIDAGADVNGFNTYKETPLMTAVCTRNLDVIIELLKHKIDINFKNEDNLNALDFAINYGYYDIIALLKQYK